MSTWHVVSTGPCHLEPGEVHVWRMPLARNPSLSVIAGCRLLLSSDEHERAARFRTDRLRTAFVLCHGSLRRILSMYVAVSPAALRFHREHHGKPVLMLAHSSRPLELHFNLSHSAELAVVAVSPQPVGVDVEQVRPMPDADRLASRFFSAAEYDAFRSIPEAGRQRAFFQCWTRKEAFVKAMGDGLSYPLASFDVSLRAATSDLLRLAGGPDEAAAWSLDAFEPADGYVGAVAIRSRRHRLSFRELSS